MDGTDFFVGFQCAARHDAVSFMAEPEAPSNYKRPEAIAEYVQKARETFMERAPTRAVTGSLTSIHLEDVNGKVLLSERSSRPGEISCVLVRFLQEREFDDYPYAVGTSFTPRRRLWGFDIDQMLRIAGLEAIRYGPEFGVPFMPALRMWHNNSGAHDPYDILMGAAERRIVSLEGLCRYLDVAEPVLLADGSGPTSSELTRVARDLCLRTGLVYLPRG